MSGNRGTIEVHASAECFWPLESLEIIYNGQVIAAQTDISGSTKIGKNCLFGGQVGIIGHITIADEVKIAAQSGIGKSILKQGEVIQGSPGFEMGKYRRSYVHFRNLDNIKKKVDELEKKMNK